MIEKKIGKDLIKEISTAVYSSWKMFESIERYARQFYAGNGAYVFRSCRVIELKLTARRKRKSSASWENGGAVVEL